MTVDFVPAMAQTCSIVTVTRNKYSDYVQTGTTSSACRFRPIVNMRRGTHEEQNDADAQIWLPYDTTAKIGTLIIFDGVTYQIERLNPAIRLGEDNPQFFKCDLKITKQV